MEHGTEREERAVAERWTALECQRRRANRFLFGLTVLVCGTLVAGLGAVSPLELCLVGGTRAPTCTTSTVTPAVRVLLLAGGTHGATAGLALCWRALR